MKTKNSRFDSLVARYYPAVYTFASRFADDPREAIALTRDAFNIARKQLRNLRDQTAVATVLISAVIRAGASPPHSLLVYQKFCSVPAGAEPAEGNKRSLPPGSPPPATMAGAIREDRYT
jgi:hypothetical protein